METNWQALRPRLIAALVNVFDEEDFAALLQDKFGRRLDELVPRDVKFPRKIREVIADAERAGWLEDLVEGARERRSDHSVLQPCVSEFQAGFAAHGKAYYQASVFIDFNQVIKESGSFSTYVSGLSRLLERLSNQHPRYVDALVYQQRLNENITYAERYGDTETRRAERAQIVDGLNRLALETMKISFNELCRSDLRLDTVVDSHLLPGANVTNIAGSQDLLKSDQAQAITDPQHLFDPPVKAIAAEMLQIGPLGSDLPVREPPLHLSLPSEYRYLGQLNGLASEHLYRTRDGHVSLLFPGVPGVIKPFLIDKYVITARQFTVCLNDLLRHGLVHTEVSLTSGVHYCTDLCSRPLVLDALDRWQRGPTAHEPWLHAPEPWGVTFQDDEWQPVPGSELLPATMVTWWGARLYSLWAHERHTEADDDKVAYLPTIQQWKMAALWQVSTRRQQRYPWGDTWRREWVNYAGYWTESEVYEADWPRHWASRADVYRRTKPLPVSSLDKGHSPIGCMQMLGNVWEWCADAPESAASGLKAVKGGACLSPQEHCSPTWDTTWRPEQGNEYVGFRCCLPMTE